MRSYTGTPSGDDCNTTALVPPTVPTARVPLTVTGRNRCAVVSVLVVSRAAWAVTSPGATARKAEAVMGKSLGTSGLGRHSGGNS